MCTDFQPANGPVRMVVTNKDGKLIWLDTGKASVDSGDVIKIASAKLQKDNFTDKLLVSLYDASGNPVQKVIFQSDCNKELSLNDHFGGYRSWESQRRRRVPFRW